MEKRFSNKIPDLKLPPWRKIRLYDFKAKGGEIIGSYCEYVSEQTGSLGLEIRVNGYPEKIIIWEEIIYIKGSEARLNYMAYREENSSWHRLRVRDMYPSDAILIDSQIHISFTLLINQKFWVLICVKRKAP